MAIGSLSGASGTSVSSILQQQLQQSQLLAQLASGNLLTSAAVNPAATTLAEQLTAQVNGLGQAQNNAADAINMLNTADSALASDQAVLQQQRTLTVEAGNGALAPSDLQAIQTQLNSLNQNINDIANQTQFNTKPLLNGQAGGLQIAGGGAVATNANGINGVTSGTANISVTALGSSAQVTGTASVQNGTFSGPGSLSIAGPNGSANFATTTNETVGQLVQDVNNAGIGVQASVNSNGQFQLTSQQPGTNAQVTVTNAGGSVAANLGLTTGQTSTGTNATATVNGQAFTGQGNTFSISGPGSGSLLGLQFTATQTGQTQVTVSNSPGVNFQVGANAGQTAGAAIGAENTAQLGIANLDVTTPGGQQQALQQLDQAINSTSQQRANIGATINSLQSTSNNAGAAQSNQLAALSQVADTNMAQASIQFVNSLVLQQFSLFALQQQSNAFSLQSQLLGV